MPSFVRFFHTSPLVYRFASFFSFSSFLSTHTRTHSWDDALSANDIRIGRAHSSMLIELMASYGIRINGNLVQVVSSVNQRRIE